MQTVPVRGIIRRAFGLGTVVVLWRAAPRAGWSQFSSTKGASGSDWVTFHRRDDDLDADEFWDGSKWVNSPEDARVHEGFSSGWSSALLAIETTRWENLYSPEPSKGTEMPNVFSNPLYR